MFSLDHKYHMVKFILDDTKELIHNGWIKEISQKNKRKGTCYFLMGTSADKLKKALKTKIKPMSKWKKNWEEYEIKILHTYGNNYCIFILFL